MTGQDSLIPSHNSPHSFYIPVMGLGFSIDTPLKVARFGISSTVSVMDDELIERLRIHHARKVNKGCTPISTKEEDYRAKRITAYLDLLKEVVDEQIKSMRTLPFEKGNELSKYFELLPDGSGLKQRYKEMLATGDPYLNATRQQELHDALVAGAIDVNIMAKVDRLTIDEDGHEIVSENSDALSALRGFANSSLHSSLVLSAGYNPRLYAYLEQFEHFFPDTLSRIKKKIILKVSDYRSALVQGKLLAKKGLWVSEFRIESGLNCGGHAFATEGMLLGPILEEFRRNRESLKQELLGLCNRANEEKGRNALVDPEMRITAQGGIGTWREHEFLMSHYGLDACGWGSPFLLVPEATSVDEETLNALATASKEDYYLSHASPLGIPFNNFRRSSSERQRKERIAKGRPGSPCYKKLLSSDKEFTTAPVCTASRTYQNLKLKQLESSELSGEAFEQAFDAITEKDCLCEGLGAGALLKEGIQPAHKLRAVTICPGPNLAYFSGIHSLQDMVDHIYGRKNLLNQLVRPHMFVNELQLYVDYLQKKIRNAPANDSRFQKNVDTFRQNLLKGIMYYEDLLAFMTQESADDIAAMRKDLGQFATVLESASPLEACTC